MYSAAVLSVQRVHMWLCESVGMGWAGCIWEVHDRKHGIIWGIPQARLSSCSRCKVEIALVYLTNPMYFR